MRKGRHRKEKNERSVQTSSSAGFWLWLTVAGWLFLLGASEAPPSSANPYTSGCLYKSLPGWNKKRVCNSDDPPDAVKSGLCRQPTIPDTLEIRIYSFNWESAYFEGFLLQIILSELLDVPVTIESGNADVHVSLYDPLVRFEFGATSDPITTSAFRNAANYNQDCTLASSDNEKDYEPCAHHFPEIWNVDTGWLQEGISDNTLEFPYALGMVAHTGVYVTKFTAEQEPSIVSYFGMMGETNRQKLAELFPRPYRWGDYCSFVSPTNCQQPDQYARNGPPPNEQDGNHFFVEGNYTGYFQPTNENNCIDNPLTCSGHLAPYPCGWTSYAETWMYHLDIALEGGGNDPTMHNNGYQYWELVELIAAANATKSNLILEFWTPTLLSETLRRTEVELIRVAFPYPTQECLSQRHSLDDVCSPNQATRVGDPIAVCDNPSSALTQSVTSGLKDVIGQQDEAIQSPAYDVLKRFLITEFQLSEIFQSLQATTAGSTTTAASPPRDATCQWAVDNFDSFLLPLIPPSHPRTLQETSQPVWTWFGVSLGFLTCGLVIVTAFRVYKQRNSRAIRYAQIEFLWLLLLGGLTLAIGAIVAALPPSDFNCVAITWLTFLGYAMILVPLIIKVAAINRLNLAAKKMKRVTIDRSSLLGVTAAIIFCGFIYMAIWTGLDAPAKTAEYQLTETIIDPSTAEEEEESDSSDWDNDSSEDDNDYNQYTKSTIVDVSYYCSSKSQVWSYVGVGWNGILLVCCTVLAVQTRSVRQEFRESTVLGLLIYSHFAIALVLLMTFILAPYTRASTMAKVQSILYSLDTLTTIIIYFVPKLLANTGFFRRTLGTINFSLPSSHTGRDRCQPNIAARLGGTSERSSAVSSDGPSEQQKEAVAPQGDKCGNETVKEENRNGDHHHLVTRRDDLGSSSSRDKKRHLPTLSSVRFFQGPEALSFYGEEDDIVAGDDDGEYVTVEMDLCNQEEMVSVKVHPQSEGMLRSFLYNVEQIRIENATLKEERAKDD